MLGAAERIGEEDDVLAFPPAALATPRVDKAAPVSFRPPSRYQQRGSPNWLAIAIILALHAVAIAAIMHVRHERHRRAEARLSVFNLTPPPPPPSEEAPPPPPSQPQVVAPPPLVRTPSPPPAIRTTPDPQPQVAAIAPVVAAPAAPVVAAASVSAAPPSTVQGGDLGAQMIAGKPPRYPVESRRKREQGTVLLALTLAPDGSVDTIAVARSSGFSRLDNAALDAVRRWRWKPMVQQGQPVRVKGVVEIPFVLQGAAA